MQPPKWCSALACRSYMSSYCCASGKTQLYICHATACAGAGGLAWLIAVLAQPALLERRRLFGQILTLLEQLLSLEHQPKEQVRQTAETLSEMQIMWHLASKLEPAFVKGEEQEAKAGRFAHGCLHCNVKHTCTEPAVIHT